MQFTFRNETLISHKPVFSLSKLCKLQVETHMLRLVFIFFHFRLKRLFDEYFNSQIISIKQNKKSSIFK